MENCVKGSLEQKILQIEYLYLKYAHFANLVTNTYLHREIMTVIRIKL